MKDVIKTHGRIPKGEVPKEINLLETKADADDRSRGIAVHPDARQAGSNRSDSGPRLTGCQVLHRGSPLPEPFRTGVANPAITET